MKCPNCSAELNDNARFCPQCGTAIDPQVDNNTVMADEDNEFVPTSSGDDADILRPADTQRRDEMPDERYTDMNYRGNRAQRRAGKRNKKPNNSYKKPLIIAIIALVLVIAIVLGVIFFVSRKTVSAKELQKAKDNYLPPAQAVTIDTSLSDPSNDAIQFKYDDHARIISCTYSVNKMTYDQSYTYDENMRKINVETTYRAQPIFTKELDYDRVTKPDTFEEVDGYYIRLCKEDLADTGATEPPQETAAPEATEPPTDPPTEPPAEEPTDPPADWKELYIDFLNTTNVFGNEILHYQSGKFFYINDDDTPELLLCTGAGAHAGIYELCWIDNGTVQHQEIAAAVFTYQERAGIIYSAIGGNLNSGWHMFGFDGTSISITHSGSRNASDFGSPVFEYKVDDEVVSKEEYDSAYAECRDWPSLSREDSWTKRTSLPDYIRNY